MNTDGFVPSDFSCTTLMIVCIYNGFEIEGQGGFEIGILGENPGSSIVVSMDYHLRFMNINIQFTSHEQSK